VTADRLRRLLHELDDADVLAGIGAAEVHLGFRDALFRRGRRGRRGPAYPTFRLDAARGRIAGYRTQFAGLFRDGTVPTRPEIYWLPANDSTTAA
jgi:hypothetical protein